MRKSEVVTFFGGVTATARALRMSHSTVSEWGETVPKERQAHVELAMRYEQEERDKEAKKQARKEARRRKAMQVVTA